MIFFNSDSIPEIITILKKNDSLLKRKKLYYQDGIKSYLVVKIEEFTEELYNYQPLKNIKKGYCLTFSCSSKLKFTLSDSCVHFIENKLDSVKPKSRSSKSDNSDNIISWVASDIGKFLF